VSLGLLMRLGDACGDAVVRRAIMTVNKRLFEEGVCAEGKADWNATFVVERLNRGGVVTDLLR
jgi:hypothetical protein